MAFYFVSTFAIAQTPTKQPALRLSRTKNLHFAKATFPGFSANVDHATLNRWVIRYLPAIAVKATSQKRETNRSWRMDETYIKVKGE
jgi:hypothetical protein